MFRSPTLSRLSRAKEMDEVAETLDDVGVEGSVRGKKGHYRAGWLNLLDPFWRNHQRDLFVCHGIRRLDPCCLPKDSGDEQAVPCAPSVHVPAGNLEAMGHLGEGQPPKPDDRSGIIVINSGPFGKGFTDSAFRKNKGLGETFRRNWFALCQQAIESNGNSSLARSELRHRIYDFVSEIIVS